MICGGLPHHQDLEGDDQAKKCDRAGHLHMKIDRRQDHNPLKGALGDALHAVSGGAGHNLRLILAAQWLCYARLELRLSALIALVMRHPQAVATA